jgi:hypothetical protein
VSARALTKPGNGQAAIHPFLDVGWLSQVWVTTSSLTDTLPSCVSDYSIHRKAMPLILYGAAIDACLTGDAASAMADELMQVTL